MKNSLVLLLFVIVACAPAPSIPTLVSSPIPTAVESLEPTAEPFTEFPPTESLPLPTDTPLPFHGSLRFPFLQADAGNFQLQTGATITFTWFEAPFDAEYYEFVIHPLDGSDAMVLGVDHDPSDEVGISWNVLPGIAAELRGVAYFADGRLPQESYPSTIYSSPAP